MLVLDFSFNLEFEILPFLYIILCVLSSLLNISVLSHYNHNFLQGLSFEFAVVEFKVNNIGC